jgi:hypothetical protein
MDALIKSFLTPVKLGKQRSQMNQFAMMPIELILGFLV